MSSFTPNKARQAPAQAPLSGISVSRRTSSSCPSLTPIFAVALPLAAAAVFFLSLSNLSPSSGSLSSLWSPQYTSERLAQGSLEQGGRDFRQNIAEEEGMTMKQTKQPAAVLHEGMNPDQNLSRLESSLRRARFSIKGASRGASSSSLTREGYIPFGPIYKNAQAFHRSYLEMENIFRVFVYSEGEPPLFHDGPCKSIYSMEGRFMHTLETRNRFLTGDPEKAHVYFLPFSITKMVKFLYRPQSFDIGHIELTIADYVNVIAQKYRFWNRSLGADHFILSCHDWAPKASSAETHLYSNSIRVLCNANTSEGFNPMKDVSLPEINLITGHTRGILGGPSPSRRPVLAFFAGGLHGPIRPLLIEKWKGKDEDIQVYEYLPKGYSYYDMMRKARFCICPSGYEVASPRIVEAIYLECIPVIISDAYVLPFSDVLNWKSFSIHVQTKDIPNLKKILQAVSQSQYIRMQRRVKLVQRHFVVNTPPQKYDVFHMILHSIWLRRLNIRINPEAL